MLNYKEVTSEQFYAVVGPMDVSVHPVGPWPYTVFFKTRKGEIIGKSINSKEFNGPDTYMLWCVEESSR